MHFFFNAKYCRYYGITTAKKNLLSRQFSMSVAVGCDAVMAKINDY